MGTDRDGCSSPEEILDCIDGDQCDNEETGEVADHLMVTELAPSAGAVFFVTSLINPPPMPCFGIEI